MSDKTIQLPKTAIPLPMDEIAAFCQRWNIVRLEVFGSILRDDFDPARSDVDFLVTYAPEARLNLRTMNTMYDELEALLGRKVDLLRRGSVQEMKNYIVRRAILDTAEVIYEQ